ncbi:putative kinase [Staphylococcus auricularis]
MRLVVVYGAPMAGKTTYVSNRFNDNDIVYDYDALSHMITLSNYQTYNDNAHQLLLNIRDSMIDYAKWQEEGTMYVITTFLSKAITQRVKRLGIDADYVMMDTTLDTCLDRLETSNRESKEHIKKVIHDWYQRYGNTVASDRVVDKETMRFYKSKRWRDVRAQVLKRDNYECQACKAQGKVTTIDQSKHKSLDVDHIQELQARPDLAYDMSNLVTLCVSCHNKKHRRYQNKFSKKNEKWKDEKW